MQKLGYNIAARLFFGAAMLSLTLPAASAAEKFGQANVILQTNLGEGDAGFQAFVDGNGWETITLIGPAGVVAQFKPQGEIGQLGLTELFVESTEPELAKMPMADLLAKLPAGKYEFRGQASKLGGANGTIIGTAMLSHKFAEGASNMDPNDGAVIPTGDVAFSWHPATKAQDGSPLKIIAQRLIVESDNPADTRIVGTQGLSMSLASDIASFRVPASFFSANTPYTWEVVSIAESGNQTVQGGTFKTR